MPSVNSDKSHVQVYSGDFVPLTDYKQFDIVTAKDVEGVFYYAREDIVKGGGADIDGYNRFIFDGAANSITDTQVNPITDEGRFLDEGFKAGQLIEIEGASEPRNNRTFIVKSVTASVLSVVNRAFRPDIINEINTNPEGQATEHIYIKALDQSPGESARELWSQNDFFFDADYGSSVNFTTNTRKFEFGDGYYAVQSKGINSLDTKFHLQFDNRTTREASCIVHFLENKLGQHEIDQPVDYLPYKQGISGFHWDGSSMFFPYNSTENLTKTFYCRSWDHSLTSENSNKVTCTLENFDTSILRKSEQIWTERVDSWNKNLPYYKNDIVFISGNHQFYYHSGEYTNASTASHPTGWNGVAAPENNPWTREFYWPPALGLQIKEEPRLKEMNLGYNSYKQIYNEGINESLLKFELNFEGRDDKEAKAILHFLETHHGSKSFSMTLPAPYNSRRRFLCPEWDHTYVFKNTHDVRCQVEEFPFNFTDEEFDNVVSHTDLRGGEVNAPGFVTMGKVDPTGNIAWPDGIERGEKRRRRIEICNLGDVSITGLRIEGPYAYHGDDVFEGTRVNLTGDSASRDALGAFDPDLWQFTPLTDKEKGVTDVAADYGRIKIPPGISAGPEGGLYFYQIDDAGVGVTGFFQNNQGNIQSLQGTGAHPAAMLGDFNSPTTSRVIKDSSDLFTSLTYPTEYKNWRLLHDDALGQAMVPLNQNLPIATPTTLTKNVTTSLAPAESAYFELVFNPYQNTLKENKLYATKLRVASSTAPPPGEDLPPAKAYADILVLAFSGTKWRADQLNQAKTRYPGGKLKASHVSVIDETENTDPYVYYDGNFDGQLKLTVDESSLTSQDLGDNIHAKMWAISRNGGTSWKMFNSTVGDPYTFEWKGIEAGIQRLAIADLVSEEMLTTQVAIGLLPKVWVITRSERSTFSRVLGSLNPVTALAMKGASEGKAAGYWTHPGKGVRRTLQPDWLSGRIYES